MMERFGIKVKDNLQLATGLLCFSQIFDITESENVLETMIDCDPKLRESVNN